MPEIGEVHRIVHYCRKHLVNRTIGSVRANEDTIVYLTDKTGLTAKKLETSLIGKKVVDAKRQGKYFWLELDKPPHLLMHFGMTGWMKFSNDDSAYYKPMKERKKEEKLKAERAAKGEDEQQQPLEATEGEDWPPRFWKFELQMEGEPKTAAAFIDARRLARVRLIDADAAEMRKTTPLKENGPDPVIDAGVFTPEWFRDKLWSKKVPVKALMLDQANISGIGNWVADEALYQARLHPEQYSNTFTEAQAKKLHDAIVHVCGTACDVLADSSKFPDTWIMRYRWGKGKKGENKLPNGQTITWVTVGGRTSAIVPAVQKKTGAVAADVAESDEESPAELKKQPRNRGTKKQSRQEDHVKEEEEEEVELQEKKGARTQARRHLASTTDDAVEQPVARSKRKADPAPETKSKSRPSKKSRAAETVVKDEDPPPLANGRRRSARLK